MKATIIPMSDCPFNHADCKDCATCIHCGREWEKENLGDIKVAKTQITVVEVICPNCEEAIESPEIGNFLFNLTDVYPEVLNCRYCGKKCQTPKKLRSQ